MKLKKLSLLGIILMGNIFSCFSIEQDSLRLFFRTQQSLQQEKLYIHTDKPRYQIGDTIWLRGTLVNAVTHSLAVKTNYIYVELFNSSKKLISQKMLRRDNLCFHNNFILPDTLTAGKYTLQAYTNWMKNFGEEFFFSRNLYIVDIGNSITKNVTKKKKQDFAVTFFPEGGALLAGVSQRIAFKVQASDGYSTSADGKIVDSKGNILARFSTIHDGMGSFLLNVPANETLKAIVTTRQDKEVKEFELPDIATNGAVLSITPHKEKLSYQILGNSSIPMNLIVHCRGKLLETIYLNEQTKRKGELSTSSYPDGIIQLLLCDNNGKAFSRRLSFVRNDKQEKWSVTPNKPLTKKREKIILDLALSMDSLPLRGDFSVSVTDAGQVSPDFFSDHIVSNLLMTSDLKGYIENPAWYFEDTDSLKQEALDLVMQTHGWSRFATDNVYTPVIPHLDYKLEAGQYLSGRVEGIPKKEKDNLISIMDTNNGTYVSGKLDANNRFYFDGIEFPDSLALRAKLLSTRKYRLSIQIDTPKFPDLYRKEPIALFSRINESTNGQAKEGQATTYDGIRIIELPQVVIARKYITKSILGNVWIDKIWNFTAERINKELDTNIFKDAEQLIGEIISDNLWTDSIVTVIVNNVPYKNEGILKDIDSKAIDRIEFVRSEYNSLNWNKEGGAVIITLKPGQTIYKPLYDQRLVAFSPLGFAWPEYFYHPVYDTPEQKSCSLSDQRTTLYWNPSIQTDEKGRCKVAFYTSDRPGDYHIVIEGVTTGGRPVRYSSPL